MNSRPTGSVTASAAYSPVRPHAQKQIGQILMGESTGPVRSTTLRGLEGTRTDKDIVNGESTSIHIDPRLCRFILPGGANCRPQESCRKLLRTKSVHRSRFRQMPHSA